MNITKKNDLRFMTFVSPLHFMLLMCLCMFLLSFCMLGWLVRVLSKYFTKKETKIARRRSVLLNRTERCVCKHLTNCTTMCGPLVFSFDSYLEKNRKMQEIIGKSNKTILVAPLHAYRQTFSFSIYRPPKSQYKQTT